MTIYFRKKNYEPSHVLAIMSALVLWLFTACQPVTMQ